MPRRNRKLELEGYEVKDPARCYLGEGTYGTVYLAIEKASGRHVAIKQHHNIAHEKGIPPSVLRETTLLNLLKNSPYVVKMEKAVHVKPSKAGQPPTTYMIFEHLDCDLHDFQSRHSPLASDTVQRIMYHILIGLHHCHYIGLMHRDLKPHNILLGNSNTKNPVTKIADFGFGRSFTLPIRQLTDEIVTLWYRAPEVLLGYEGHSPAVDVWSTACIFAELYQNAVLFCGDSEFDQLVKIFRLVGTPSEGDWKKLPSDYMTSMPSDAIDLLEKMLVHDPAKRPTPENCLKHPYFASLFKESDLDTTPLLPGDICPISPPSQRTMSDPTSSKSHRKPTSREIRFLPSPAGPY